MKPTFWNEVFDCQKDMCDKDDRSFKKENMGVVEGRCLAEISRYYQNRKHHNEGNCWIFKMSGPDC